MTIYDVDPTELIDEVAKELQKIKEITPPQWASFVKTGANRERPPARQDWWYVRASSLLRKVRLKGPIGISKLRTLYGGLKNRGHKPEQFRRSSGSILRKILQQMEKAELVKKDKKGVHKGRIITPKGIKLMDNVAKKIGGNKQIEAKPKEGKKEDVKSKVEELAKKTKEFAQGKKPTAEKLVEEAKKEEKTKEVKENKENVPTAAQLAAKKEAKNG